MVLHKELGVAQKKLFRQSVLQNERSIFSLLVLKLEVQKKKKKKNVRFSTGPILKRINKVKLFCTGLPIAKAPERNLDNTLTQLMTTL